MRVQIIILFLLATAFNASAQADTSYHLLWYKGKKIKPNVLLTPKGDSVFYNPEKASVKMVSKTGQGNRLDKMLAELNRNSKRMNEMVQKFSAALPSKKLLPAFAVQVKKAYEQVRIDYGGALSNTMTIPAVTIPGIQANTGKGGHSLDEIDLEQKFDDFVAEFKQYMLSHQNDQISWVPTPPRYDFSYCYPCDIERQKQYEREFEVFGNELAGGDYPIMQKALGASRQAHFLLQTEKNEQIQRELSNVINFIWVRMEKKANLVLEKYINDPYRVHAVLQVVLASDRIYQLTAPEGTKGFGTSDYVKEGAFTIARFISRAVDEKDYSVALNIRAILGTERMLQLIGSTMPDNIFDKVIKFNQFKLNLRVSGKIGTASDYSLAEVTGDNWFYAVPDTSCKLNWILVGPYMNKMKIDLLAAEWKGRGGEIPYVGTKNWNTDVASFKVDFCNEKPDSITFYPFFPEGFKELWQFPQPWGVRDVIQVGAIFQMCFLDVERTKEDYAQFKDPANVAKLKKEMVAKYQQMLKNNKSHTVARPPGEDYGILSLDKWAEMQQMSKEFSELVHSVSIGRVIFTPEVSNRNAVIIKDKINGKELFPQNGAIQYGWYHIKLEHDPDGPYPTLLY